MVADKLTFEEDFVDPNAVPVPPATKKVPVIVTPPPVVVMPQTPAPKPAPKPKPVILIPPPQLPPQQTTQLGIPAAPVVIGMPPATPQVPPPAEIRDTLQEHARGPKDTVSDTVENLGDIELEALRVEFPGIVKALEQAEAVTSIEEYLALSPASLGKLRTDLESGEDLEGSTRKLRARFALATKVLDGFKTELDRLETARQQAAVAQEANKKEQERIMKGEDQNETKPEKASSKPGHFRQYWWVYGLIVGVLALCVACLYGMRWGYHQVFPSHSARRPTAAATIPVTPSEPAPVETAPSPTVEPPAPSPTAMPAADGTCSEPLGAACVISHEGDRFHLRADGHTWDCTSMRNLHGRDYAHFPLAELTFDQQAEGQVVRCDLPAGQQLPMHGTNVDLTVCHACRTTD